MRPLGIALQVFVSLGIIAAGVVGFTALGSKPAPPRKAAEADPRVPVTTIPVGSEETGLPIAVDGEVVPYRQLTVYAEVSGRLTGRADACEVGRPVTQGTLLYTLDPADLELRRDQLRAQLAEAKLTVLEASVELDNNSRLLALGKEDLELQRQELQRLLALSSTIGVSESDLDRARRAELGGRQSVQGLLNQRASLMVRRDRLETVVHRLASALAEAELDLSRTTIYAPIDGVIVSVMAEQEAVVGPGAPLVTIEDTRHVEILCNLRMEELELLWQGYAGVDYVGWLPPAPVAIRLRPTDAEAGWQGRLDRLDGNRIDAKTRTVPCRIRVAEGGRDQEGDSPMALIPGMYTHLRVISRPADQLLIVPEAALRPGHVLWVAREGRLHIATVRVLRLDAGKCYLDPRDEGVHEGDRIIVSPLTEVTEGMPIRAEETP